MKINKINKLKSGLYQVTLEHDEQRLKVKITEDQLIELNLYTKKELSEDLVEQLKEMERYSKFYTSALNYVSYRMRSEYEISLYLDKKDCSQVFKEKIIERLKSLRYIDDEKYTTEYIRYQQSMNLKGPLILSKELYKKGVNDAIIKRALSSYSRDLQFKNIEHLIDKAVKVPSKKPLRKLKESILKKIINKGYDYGIVNDVMKDYTFDLDINEDSLIENELNKLYAKYSRKHEGYELKAKLTQVLMRKGFDYETINRCINNYTSSKEEDA